MHRSILLLLAFLSSGCAIFGVVPPSRLDVGVGGAVGDGTDWRMRVSYGASLASALKRDVPMDVTAGVIGDVPAEKHPKNEAAHWAIGMFFEPSVRIAHWKSDDVHFRVWLGPRAELFPGQVDGRALLLRSTLEIWTPVMAVGSSSSRKSFAFGGIYGSAGVGLYLEAGMRQLPQDAPGVLVTGGIVIRFPATAGIAGFTK